jgi:hypothetical protein
VTAFSGFRARPGKDGSGGAWGAKSGRAQQRPMARIALGIQFATN